MEKESCRCRFENMKKEQEEEAARRVVEERNKRVAVDGQIKSPAKEESRVVAPEPTIYENLSVPPQPTDSTKIVGGIDVSSLLRQRQPSSSSSKKDEDEDEWAVEDAHHQPHAATPSSAPTAPAAPSVQPEMNEGIRCIARYSYQKSTSNGMKKSNQTDFVPFCFSGRRWIRVRRKRNYHPRGKGNTERENVRIEIEEGNDLDARWMVVRPYWISFGSFSCQLCRRTLIWFSNKRLSLSVLSPRA